MNKGNIITVLFIGIGLGIGIGFCLAKMGKKNRVMKEKSWRQKDLLKVGRIL